MMNPAILETTKFFSGFLPVILCMLFSGFSLMISMIVWLTWVKQRIKEGKCKDTMFEKSD
jgi:hypothetical protein